MIKLGELVAFQSQANKLDRGYDAERDHWTAQRMVAILELSGTDQRVRLTLWNVREYRLVED